MTYLHRLLETLRGRGHEVGSLLAELGVAPEATIDPNGWVALSTFAEALHRGAELTRDPSLGLELGLSLKPTAHSWYGYALMTAATVRQACELGIRFLDVRLTPWRVSMFTEGDTAVMQFEERYELGPSRQLMVDAFLTCAVRMAEFLHGQSLAGSELEFYATFPRPAYYDRFADRLPRTHHDCPVMQARHPTAWLDRPVLLADRHTNHEAVSVLEQALHTIDPDDWIASTRAMLTDRRNGYLDLDAGAAKLGLSSRSLRRHLRARGTTYRELREAARREAATSLIATGRSSLEVIARQLGYGDVAAFTRAFQRWTGESPATYRQKSRLDATPRSAERPRFT